MNTSAEILYGSFPRTVASSTNGYLHQDFLNSKGEFDIWFKEMRPERDLYSSICRFRADMRRVLDKVVWDFDSPMKNSAFEEGVSDIEKIELMREDEDLTEEVLGPVWNDVQNLAEFCQEENIPVISVFSGLGVHSHMLYQERVSPNAEKVSITQYVSDEADLHTWDRAILTDTRRVLRVPNSQRMDHGEPTGVWCIPFTEEEALQNSPTDLLDRCSSPKTLEFEERYAEENRPKMEVVEGYENVDSESVGDIPLEERDIDTEVPDDVRWMVRNFIPLPCVAERFLRSNPHHMIRFNGAIHLYQAGFTPEQVREIIRNIGWIDYNEGITRKMTDQIWKRKYSENKCSTLESHGLCVFGPEFDDFSNDMSDCDTYGWTSGPARYG